MMARQIIETGIYITLPEYKCSLTKQAKGKCFKEDFLVAKSSTILLDNIDKEASFEKCVVDVMSRVGDFIFVIYLPIQTVHFQVGYLPHITDNAVYSKSSLMIHTTYLHTIKRQELDN